MNLEESRLLRHDGIHYLEMMGLLDRHLSPRSYFEIGTNMGASLERFSCDAVCVDPNFLIERNVWTPRKRSFLFQMTSDDFFREENVRSYLSHGPDIAFLDGMHLFEYLLRDFINIEAACHKQSIILIHDCLPLGARMAERTYRGGEDAEGEFKWAWTGDVWKILHVFKRFRPDLNVQLLDCPPTGLVAVSRLDPASTVLSSSYADAMSMANNQSIEGGALNELWSLFPTIPTKIYQTEPSLISANFNCRRLGCVDKARERDSPDTE